MNRIEAWSTLSTAWDVLVVGGGATGLGIAVDAATRGFNVELVEAGDFAQSTSSRSTKLAHGGVRYLATGQVSLVREALEERAVMLRNAPHLVRPPPTILPAQHWWELPYHGAGLKMYDLLAGSSSMGPTRLLNQRAVAERMPGVKPGLAHGGVLYHDAQFNDARYALMLARTAADDGAMVLDYVRRTGLLYSGDQPRSVIGATLRDLETGEIAEMRARVVVNAAGIFSDDLRAQGEPGRAPLLRVSRGARLPQGGDDPFVAEYGSDAGALDALVAHEASLGHRFEPEPPYTGAMVVHAVRAEFAQTLEDVLSRRTRALLINARAAIRALPPWRH